MATVHDVKYERKPSAVKDKLAKYDRSLEELQAIEELAPWHCVALARHVVYGQPYTEVGKEMRHSPHTIGAVAKSPAGQAFVAKITANLHDPERWVKDLMRSDTPEMWLIWRNALEWAVKAQDYEAIHRMAKDVGLQPVLQQADKAGPSRIVLNLNMGDLATPVVKTSFHVMEAEIVEEGDSNE